MLDADTLKKKKKSTFYCKKSYALKINSICVELFVSNSTTSPPVQEYANLLFAGAQPG